MANGSVPLTRRRFVGGLLTVAGASAAAGAGTVAYLSDTESSAGNSVQAGTLNLTLDDQNETVPFLQESDITPGESGSSELPLANTGRIDGSLTVEISEIRSFDKQDDPGGSLDDYLAVYAELDGATEPNNYTLVSDLSEDQVLFSDHLLTGGETDDFQLHWELRDQGGVNSAKGHRVELDLTFRLDQVGGA